MSIDKNCDNIQVMVRVRPLNNREQVEESHSCIIIYEDNPQTIILDAKPDQKIFNFDWVGDEKTTQAQVFDIIGKPMISTCLEGYNCCIFAYGQTGAGKTYTMQGRGLEIDSIDSEYRGLQPRVFDIIFMLMHKEMKENPNVQYLTTCSYLEIYNETIVDLLEPLGPNLHIREDLRKGVYVESLKEENIANSNEIIELLRKGARNRHIGSTNMNIESSRSHSVFSLTIERKKTLGSMMQVRTSKFHFVDLAGSERQKSSAAIGERLKEAGNINKSLSVLGAVINSLVEISEGKQRHIRYRDSKLTFLLKDSLGGNSKTCIIANISPASNSFSETLSTLKFAQRAKQIKNKASINEDSTGNLEDLKKEIKRLKDELAQTKNIINVIENEEKKKFKTPNKTPTSKYLNGVDDFHVKQLLNHNYKELEMELLLKQSLDVLKQNELLFENELARQEELLNSYKFASNQEHNNELQYRIIIDLQRQRISRYEMMNKMCHDNNDIEKLIQDENDLLKKENIALFELLKIMPYVMKTYEENVELNERLYNLDYEDNGSSIGRQLKENHILLQQLMFQLDDNIRERKSLAEVFKRIGLMQVPVTPYKQTYYDEEIFSIRSEYNMEIDKLKKEIEIQKENILELEHSLDIEKRKGIEITREYENLKESKLRDESQYNKKIKELIQDFEFMQNTKINITQLEQYNHQLNIKNIELKEQLDNYMNKYDEALRRLTEKDIIMKEIIEEKEELEKKYNLLHGDNIKEKNNYDNMLKCLEDENKRKDEDIRNSKMKINELLNEISILYEEQNEYRSNEEMLYEEKNKMKNELEEIISQKTDELVRIERILDKERVEFEKNENEKKKLQEDYDTVIQTLNYNIVELEQKHLIINELNIKIKDYLLRIDGLNERVFNQDMMIKSLNSQIHDQNRI